MTSSALKRPSQLLAISYSYPPQTEPRAIQVSRLLAHLKWPTVLVCEGAVENDLQKQDSNVTTVRVPAPVTSLRQFSLRLASQFNLPVWFRTPDHLHPWKSRVLDRVEQMISTEQFRPEVLVTFSFPLIDSVIGFELKRRYGFPWLAHFSDPWVDSPFKQYDRLTRLLNVRLERSVIENADRLVFTSGETADLVMAKYAPDLRDKVRIVPHAFEPNHFQSRKVREKDRLVIRYLGDLYLDRTPRPLFDALRQLLAADPQLVSRFRFEIVGDIHQLNLKSMGFDDLPEDLVVLRQRVSYDESCDLMASADGLMVIDAPVPSGAKSVFLPSKLIEYVGAGRPIIGLTPDGTAADLITQLGGWVANPTDSATLATVMRDFLKFVAQRDEDLTWGATDVRSEFEARNVATKFEQILSELQD
jgi:glycosyltransferase involved in cell wall biosynthesis